MNKMNEKWLSIIVPAYNMEKYLKECLGSLIVSLEMMDRLEVVVINDGSNDRTSEIAHEFETRYPSTFRVIDKKNGNYGSCINVALKAVSGEFVKVLDADDSFDTEGLSLLLERCRVSDADLILTDWEDVDANRKSLGHRKLNLAPGSQISVSTFVLKNTSLQMCSMAYRRSLFAGGWYRQKEKISYSDVQWSFLPLARVQQIEYLPHCVYRILTSREGQTSTLQARRKNYQMILDMYVDMLNQYLQSRGSLSEDTRKALDTFAAKYAEGVYRTGLILNVSVNLREFDSAIKRACGDVYDLAGNMPRGRVKFNVVRHWRRRYNPVSRALVWAYCIVMRKRWGL